MRCGKIVSILILATLLFAAVPPVSAMNIVNYYETNLTDVSAVQEFFYAKGLFWTTFVRLSATSQQFLYASSADLQNWTPIQIEQGYNHVTFWDKSEEILHVIYLDNQYPPFSLYYMQGVPSSDGNITFSEPVLLLSQQMFVPGAKITVDNNSFPVLLFYGGMIFRATNKYGTSWTNATLPISSSVSPIDAVALSDGSIFAAYGGIEGGVLYLYLINGDNSCNLVEEFRLEDIGFFQCDVHLDGDVVYGAAISSFQIGDSLRFFTYNASSGIFTSKILPNFNVTEDISLGSPIVYFDQQLNRVALFIHRTNWAELTSHLLGTTFSPSDDPEDITVKLSSEGAFDSAVGRIVVLNGSYFYLGISGVYFVSAVIDLGEGAEGEEGGGWHIKAYDTWVDFQGNFTYSSYSVDDPNNNTYFIWYNPVLVAPYEVPNNPFTKNSVGLSARNCNISVQHIYWDLYQPSTTLFAIPFSQGWSYVRVYYNSTVPKGVAFSYSGYSIISEEQYYRNYDAFLNSPERAVYINYNQKYIETKFKTSTADPFAQGDHRYKIDVFWTQGDWYIRTQGGSVIAEGDGEYENPPAGGNLIKPSTGGIDLTETVSNAAQTVVNVVTSAGDEITEIISGLPPQVQVITIIGLPLILIMLLIVGSGALTGGRRK